MSAVSSPLVSVLLPVFNAERFLARTLRSLLNQTLADIEIVALDDGSADASLEILRSFQDSRLRIERNERNLGIIATLNRGLSLCSAEFIARMDADDIAVPTRLEKQYRYMATHPACVLLATGRQAIDENDLPVRSFNRPATGSALIRWKLLTGNFITHPTVMLRKSALPLPLFEDRYRHAEDYAAWLKLSCIGEMDVMPERLLLYRFHGHSISHVNKAAQVKAAMEALSNHLRNNYHGTQFSFESLALWSAPQDSGGLAKPADFLKLLLWMNPWQRSFRQELRGLPAVKAFVHYQRRLTLLLISHRKRPELMISIVLALLRSLFPRRRT
jgi:glycosyltransferase involved in cell wall biosynthesis